MNVLRSPRVFHPFSSVSDSMRLGQASWQRPEGSVLIFGFILMALLRAFVSYGWRHRLLVIIVTENLYPLADDEMKSAPRESSERLVSVPSDFLSVKAPARSGSKDTA